MGRVDPRWIRFGLQGAWTLGARGTSALLQLSVIVLLARLLGPSAFAQAMAVWAILNAVSALNGVGLNRTIQHVRATGGTESRLSGLYNARLWFTYASSAAWVAVVLLGYCFTLNAGWLPYLPLAVWLAAEQTTGVWNGINLVDGRAHLLLVSYVARRAPVVAALVICYGISWDPILAWTLGLAVGSVAAVLLTVRRQPRWARRLRLQSVKPNIDRSDLDFGFWWASLGYQVKTLDVMLISAVNPLVAGLYALPSRLIRPLMIITESVGAVAFPRLLRRPNLAPRKLLIGVCIGSIPGVAVGTALALAAPWLPLVVGDSYSGSVQPLRWLALAGALQGVSLLLTLMLQSRTESTRAFAGAASMLIGVAQPVLLGLLALFAAETVELAIAVVGLQVTLCVMLGVRLFCGRRGALDAQ